MANAIRATIDDLYAFEGNAELLEGNVKVIPAKGDAPSSAGGAISLSLRKYARKTGLGRACTSGVASLFIFCTANPSAPTHHFILGNETECDFSRAHQYLQLKSEVKTITGTRRNATWHRNEPIVLLAVRWLGRGFTWNGSDSFLPC